MILLFLVFSSLLEFGRLFNGNFFFIVLLVFASMGLIFLTEAHRVLFGICDQTSDDKTGMFSLLLNSDYTASRTFLAVIRLRSAQEFGRRHIWDS